MDPITRLLVFTIGFVAIVAITSVIYRRITGKPFITFNSGPPQSRDASEVSSPLNKQMSPLLGGVLAGVGVSAYIFYRSHDIVRALLVGSVTFAVLYWVMWAGQKLERRSKKIPAQTVGDDGRQLATEMELNAKTRRREDAKS